MRTWKTNSAWVGTLLLAGVVGATALAGQATTTSAPAASGYAEVPGGRLYYEVAGAGPTVVLIHDGLVHSAVWDGQVPELARDFQVIRYDRRGYGRSDMPSEAYSNVADLRALLEKLHVERAVLIGASAGGELALRYTLAHPEQVQALILVGSVVDSLSYSEHFIARVFANYASDLPGAVERWANDRYEVAAESTAARERLHSLLAANPQNLDPTHERWVKEPQELAIGDLTRINIPVLLMAGEADMPDIHAHAGAMESHIRGAKRVVVPHAGHLVPLEQPDVFNRAARAFLGSLWRPLSTPPAAAKARHLEYGFAPVSGSAVYYEAEGDGPPVVLMHSGITDHRMWDQQMDALTPHYRVIRFDARGHGLTKGPPMLHRDEDDLRDLLKYLNVPRAHIVGLSLGGRIAIDFALRYPDMVLSLVPVGSGLSGFEFHAPEILKLFADTQAARLAGDHEREVELFQQAWVAGPQRTLEQVDPTVRARVHEMGLLAVQPGGLGQTVVPDPPAVGRLAEIRARTLVIAGALDQPELLTFADQIARDVPGARQVRVPDAAHLVNMEKPDEFNRILLEFLASQ